MQHPDDRTDMTAGGAHPDEGTIHAWLDGELSPAEADALRTHLADCAECRVVVAEARGLVAASARILRSLDDGPGGVRANPASDLSAASGARAGGGLGGKAGDPARPASSAPAADEVGIRSIGDARTGRPAGAGGTTRAGRRWRLSAIAAVGLMAVGTTLVLQRSGPLEPFTAESTTERAAGAPPAVVAAPDSELRTASTAVAGRTEAAPEGARRTLAEVSPQGAGAPAGNPAARKAAAADEARPAAPPVAVAPRPPQSSAAVAAAARNAEPDSARLRSSSAFASPAPVSARAAPESRPLAGVAGAASPVSAEVAVIAVGPVLVGRVTSVDGDPVAQALVTVPGTTSAAVTDIAGRFRLVGMPAGEHTATVRRIGYEPARLDLRVGERGDSVVAVTLVAAESHLQDIVVTGVAAAPRPPSATAENARRVAGSEAKAPSIISRPTRPPAVVPSSLSVRPELAPSDSLTRAVIAQRTAGCYRLEIGGAPSAGRDSAETALPGWIRLAAIPAPDRPGWLEASPIARDQRNRTGSTGWRITESDDVQIVWPSASIANEVILRLSGSGEVLTGTVALRSVGAAMTDDREAASIVAVRGVCNY